MVEIPNFKSNWPISFICFLLKQIKYLHYNTLTNLFIINTYTYCNIALLFYLYLIIGYLFRYNNRKKHQPEARLTPTSQEKGFWKKMSNVVNLSSSLKTKVMEVGSWVRLRGACMRNSNDNPVCKWKKYIKLVKTLNLHFQFERQTFNNKFLNEKLILNVCQLYKVIVSKSPRFL